MKKINHKEIKKLIISIGFHHSWDSWILNENKAYRIVIDAMKNKINLRLTTDAFYYDKHIDVTYMTIEEVSLLIKEYFKLSNNIETLRLKLLNMKREREALLDVASKIIAKVIPILEAEPDELVRREILDNLYADDVETVHYFHLCRLFTPSLPKPQIF